MADSSAIMKSTKGKPSLFLRHVTTLNSSDSSPLCFNLHFYLHTQSNRFNNISGYRYQYLANIDPSFSLLTKLCSALKSKNIILCTYFVKLVDFFSNLFKVMASVY